ncbi:YgaP family membrane protein [Haloarcula brevis]|uniref:YgaP family membrane protein n=1 Tax=Haloarcula brevis TaxID=3111453 RepID=UPI00300F58A9
MEWLSECLQHQAARRERLRYLYCVLVDIKHNIGVTDRRTRIIVGLAVGVIGMATLGGLLELGMVVGTILAAAALILVGTGLVRVCPLYRLLGIDTSR